MNMKSKQPLRFVGSPIFLLAVGFIAGAIVVGLAGGIALGLAWSTGQASSSDIVHDVTVSYMYETEPGSASGNNTLPVKSIQFRPGCVVITRVSGHSSLFAIDRLRMFRFAPTESNQPESP
jgi:hypothetical protein